jgi:hypothetical protein
MSKLGYVYQSGHDGLPCPNPSPDTHDRLLYARGFTWTIPIRDCLCYAEEKRVAAKTAAAAQAEEYTKELESS